MQAQLSFVELTVSDWAHSLAWYERVLLLSVVLRDDGNRFALLRAEPVRLALKAGEPSPGSVLLTWEVDDLDGWVAHLARCGVPAEGTVKDSPEGYRRLRLRDPDGHALSLFAWRKSASSAASV